ncbi:hypothetical protein BCO37747_05230 [Burkholderia contaminans]|nr:hypothetical protein SK875_A00392 [Burkholderia contaminans]VWB36149.1 hypothetical protein BCO23253_01595 [Burkholderia contaminans]VWD39009.1 hypothetical protein BCO37747_05230 [Burkholderia contaminans]
MSNSVDVNAIFIRIDQVDIGASVNRVSYDIQAVLRKYVALSQEHDPTATFGEFSIKR